MPLGIYNSAAFLTASGVAVAPNADVEVRRESDSGLASIFSDRAGSAAIAQPGFQADATGRFEFFAAGISGGYQVTVTKGAETYTVRYQATGTARELDADPFWATVLAAANQAAAQAALDVPSTAEVDATVDAATVGFSFKNRLINPSGAIYQRAVAATADDVYFADRWYILSQTGTVTPSVLTDPEDGHPKGARITQSQAAAQRFGFAQIIEGKNCKDLRGQSGTLVPRIRASASQAIRYAILAWIGTEDAVTSDVVNDWTSADYTDGAAKFFVDANITPLVVGAVTPTANTWTSLAAITAALGSTFNNLIVFVWTEGTAAQNFTLDFDFVQLERGAVATQFERRPFVSELSLCQRYFENSKGNGDVLTSSDGYSVTSIASDFPSWPFRVGKRAVPTFTPSFSSGTGATFTVAIGAFSQINAHSAGVGFGWTATAEL